MVTITEKTFRIVGTGPNAKRIWDMDRNDTTRFPFDWTAWLAEEGSGVLIANVAWVLSPELVNVQGGFDSTTATITAKFANPAAVKGLQILTCRMTTNEAVPQVRDRSIYLNPITS